jgi:hypothetical protein
VEPDRLYPVCRIAMTVVILGLFPVSFAFLRRLRLKHSATWSHLGKPALFDSVSIKNQRAVRQFVVSGACRDLGDPTLDRLATVLKWGTRLGLALLAGCFVLYILNQPSAGR